MQPFIPFSGSYLPEDVHFLLKPVEMEMTPVEQKEQLIQSGEKHYSEMLSQEPEPTAWHLDLFARALEQGAERLAKEVVMLAKALADRFGETPVILVSLVRAGVPLGVMLHQTLREMGKTSHHYGVSIIRDRGIDDTAMDWIEAQHGTEGIVFVDGWTGKGAIYQELARSLDIFSDPNHPNFANIFHQGENVIPLLTLADPAGVAWLAASEEDWLIPSGLLNSTVSGLISRSLYTEPQSGLHRSVFYDNLVAVDHSLAFVDHIDSTRHALSTSPQYLQTFEQPRYQTAALIDTLAAEYDISNRNRIKPTIAEATRAILRRDPERILLATADHPDTVLLRHLCSERDINITVLGAKILPYQAITLIKQRATDRS